MQEQVVVTDEQGPEMLGGDGVRGIPKKLPFSRSMALPCSDPGGDVGRVPKIEGAMG